MAISLPIAEVGRINPLSVWKRHIRATGKSNEYVIFGGRASAFDGTSAC
jgi:hypothetical protein